MQRCRHHRWHSSCTSDSQRVRGLRVEHCLRPGLRITGIRLAWQRRCPCWCQTHCACTWTRFTTSSRHSSACSAISTSHMRRAIACSTISHWRADARRHTLVLSLERHKKCLRVAPVTLDALTAPMLLLTVPVPARVACTGCFRHETASSVPTFPTRCVAPGWSGRCQGYRVGSGMVTDQGFRPTKVKKGGWGHFGTPDLHEAFL